MRLGCVGRSSLGIGGGRGESGTVLAKEIELIAEIGSDPRLTVETMGQHRLSVSWKALIERLLHTLNRGVARQLRQKRRAGLLSYRLGFANPGIRCTKRRRRRRPRQSREDRIPWSFRGRRCR